MLLGDQISSLLGRVQDPPDSSWLRMTRKETDDEGNAQTVPMGKLCLSIEIWPKDAADLDPSGPGRNAPNQNP